MKEMMNAKKGRENPALKVIYQAFKEFHGSVKNENARENFIKWQRHCVPGLLSTLSACMNAVVFPALDRESPPGGLLPRLEHPSLFVIACTLPAKHRQPNWNRLYYSASQGFDLESLEESLISYVGPTIFIVKAFDKMNQTTQVFGCFASQPWLKQKTPDYFGDEESFLFQLQPKFRVYRASQQGFLSNYQYFFSDKEDNSTPQGYDVKSHANGIGLGGSMRRPRFFIDASLKSCHLGPIDATFDNAKDNNTDNIETWEMLSLQVWGVGGKEAMVAHAMRQSEKEQKELKARQREEAKTKKDKAIKQRKVNKVTFLTDVFTEGVKSKMGAHGDECRDDGLEVVVREPSRGRE